MQKTKFNIGDRVRYRTGFLKSIGCYSGPLPFALGEITEIKSYGSRIPSIATINWYSDEIPARVNVANLERLK